ncbi:MAG: FAD-dependent oxidoreductase [Pirellulaceae bacterium]|nr:FAD-dependent oxidoreductase [Planctomycetales bacterium]
MNSPSRSSEPGRTVIIGGGVIGAMTAWYLIERGEKVTIIDKQRFGSGCSHGNCGYVCPSHILPLATPGAVTSTLRTILRRNSPLAIRPRMSREFWTWMWHFTRRCNHRSMMEAARAIHPLLQLSMRLYHDLIDTQHINCEWQERGLLFVFHSAKEFEHYAGTEQMLRNEFGVGAKPYDGNQLVQLEPALKSGLGGAWHYEEDCHLRPDALMSHMRDQLACRGVQIIEGTELRNFVCHQRRGVAIRTNSGELQADRFVVATGAWTPLLNEQLGCRVPIEPGKGYSLTMPTPERAPKIPMIFEEHRVAITPMLSGYRIGSTMEFAGYDDSIDPRRLRLLKSSAELYLHQPYCDPIEEEWFGWRPMTWDSVPIIDRAPRMENVYVATGHSMLGLSMATGTGALVAEMIYGQPSSIDVRPYSLARFR